MKALPEVDSVNLNGTELRRAFGNAFMKSEMRGKSFGELGLCEGPDGSLVDMLNLPAGLTKLNNTFLIC